MLRLRCGGRTVMNCLQLYREANIQDLLEQTEAFCQFVDTHCLFSEKDTLLAQALSDMAHAGKEAKNSDLDKALSNKTLSEEQKEEIRKYREKVRQIADRQKNDHQWADRITIIGLLSRIPADKLDQQLKKQNSVTAVKTIKSENASGKGAVGANGRIHPAAGEKKIENGLLFGKERELYLTDSEYRLPYDDKLKLRDGQMIHTYCLIGKRPEGTSVFLLDPQKKTINSRIIKNGECLFVNAVDQTIVCLLPQKIQRGTSVIERSATRELVINGKVVQGTKAVTAFAMDVHNGQEQVIWIKDGCPGGNMNVRRINFLNNVVEAVMRGEKYYLLLKTGMVISNDLNADGKNCVASLSSCMGGK